MSTKITFTILSISLLTVMAGAAVAPALGTIQQHFSDSPETLVRFIVSIPALFIIVTNLLFSIVCRFLRTRSLALFGLILYVACGMGAFFADNIVGLLVLRALLGVSVGFLMPLSTGLLVYYNPPEKIADLLGISAAMNQPFCRKKYYLFQGILKMKKMQKKRRSILSASAFHPLIDWNYYCFIINIKIFSSYIPLI